MLYLVKIRREREPLAKAMSGIREWLDAQRFEPDAFRCNTDEESVTFRLEFKSEYLATSARPRVDSHITRRSASLPPRGCSRRSSSENRARLGDRWMSVVDHER